MWDKWASLVVQMVKNLSAMQETQAQFLGWEVPLEEGMQPTPVFLPGESHGQRSLVGYSPQCLKESDTTERLTWDKYREGSCGGPSWRVGFGVWLSTEEQRGWLWHPGWLSLRVLHPDPAW